MSQHSLSGRQTFYLYAIWTSVRTACRLLQAFNPDQNYDCDGKSGQGLLARTSCRAGVIQKQQVPELPTYRCFTGCSVVLSAAAR